MCKFAVVVDVGGNAFIPNCGSASPDQHAVTAELGTGNCKTVARTTSLARIQLDSALMRAIGPLLKDDTEFYKQFVQNESFKRFVTDTVANLTS